MRASHIRFLRRSFSRFGALPAAMRKLAENSVFPGRRNHVFASQSTSYSHSAATWRPQCTAAAGAST
jgi:hypothetical protein